VAGNTTPIEFFKTDRIVHLTTAQVEAMDKAAFRERAFAWRGKKTILRNLEIFGE
jgi:aromatic ring-opening dioxygenase LigB subunit